MSMGRILGRIKGTARVELSGAFPEAALNACALEALALWDMESLDRYSLRASLSERELDRLRAIAEKCGCELKVIAVSGGSRDRALLLRRRALLAFLLLTAALLLLSSLFIWEIELRGGGETDRSRVLRALADCGVEEGCFWPSLSADLVRSRVLSELPELAWMTVNVSGSRAVVLLVPRQEKPEIDAEGPPCDITAAREGIVRRLSVYAGSPLVSPGQTVSKGETLVGGLVESLANPPRLLRAQAEVTAETWYELTAARPLDFPLKTEEGRSYSRFALKIGKKRINFYFGSGKDIDECDKIVHEYNLGAEGLFALPVSLVREELIRRAPGEGEEDCAAEMEARLYASLEERIEGEILSFAFSRHRDGAMLYVTLRARCLENIAQITEIAEP